MIILAFLIIFAPALIAVLCYERFRGTELIMRKRIELVLVFAFIINFIGYTVLWLRGHTHFIWSFDADSAEITRVSFVVQYMAVSTVIAFVLAYVTSLIRIGKPEKDDEATDAPDAESQVQDSSAEESGK